MVEQEQHIVHLHDDFYRDSIGKVMVVLIGTIGGIAFLIALSIYLHMSKPSPITFIVHNDWRVQPLVALDQPYLSVPDVLQWTSDALQKSFVYDFNHYNDQLKTASPNFTADGWKVFLGQLNNYANYSNVQKNKLFITATALGAPFVLNQGLLSGRYAWWVQMPIKINYASYNQNYSQDLKLQVLVVRVSTLDNLMGVAIDNIMTAK